MLGPSRRVTTTEVSARCGVSTPYAPSAAARTLVARSKTMPIPGAVTDDVEGAASVSSRLASVKRPLAEMRRRGLQRLWSEVDGDSTSGVAVPLRAEVMIHESTGGPVSPEPGRRPVPAQASADRA